MKIILAADGSECTEKALTFLTTYVLRFDADSDLLVLNVQPPLPPRVAPMVGSEAVEDYHRDEANKVLDPVRLFLDGHAVRHRCEWVVGSAASEIVAACKREQAQMIVMGTHGRSLIGRVVMGSVAQHVVALSEVAVLLVK